MGVLFQNYTCLGFDSEWKPYFSINSVSNIALIQLAVKDKVYILDMIALADAFKGPIAKEFITFMANSQITKLGNDYHINTDTYKGD